MRVRSIELPASSGGLITGSGYITYWSVRDTTASTGSVFQLYDGNSTDSQLLVDVSTAAGESTSEYIHRGHLIYQASRYYNLASGTIEGAVTVHACDSAEELQRLIAALGTLQDIAGMTPV